METVGGFASVKKRDLDRFVESAKSKTKEHFQAQHERAIATLNQMTRVFITGDALLRRQAQIAVYYWLVRTHQEHQTNKIRNFLQDFELARSRARATANARAAGQDLPPADTTLLEYTRKVRSPDDKATQEFLFTTLEERLRQFVASSPSELL
jgi:hypothetical protein